MKFKQIGVIGAGVMGVGVAQTLVQNNHRVVLVDVSDAILEKAHSEIEKNIRFAALFDKNIRGLNHEELLARIDFTQDYQRLSEVDFLVENATEKWEIKKNLYPKLHDICPCECVFAANTSAISITRLASKTGRADKVVGMHFMNPVPQKPAVEVIKGWHTSEQTIEDAKSFLGQMGKQAIVVNDMPGFVSNRVLMLTINEAVFLIQDKVATPKDVDDIFIKCFGHKMGPLATADLIGLDTILYSLAVLYESYNDDKYRPSPLLKQMVDAGLHGRKNGQGFFEYT